MDVETKGTEDLDTAWPIQAGQTAEACARTEHLQLVVAYSIYVLLGNLAASGTLLIGAWERISHPWLLAWFATMLVFNVLRWVVGRRFPDGPLTDAELRRWEQRFIISVIFSGLLWGFAGGFFFMPGDSGHNFFLALLIIGMAAAAATSLSYHRTAYPAFFLPAVTPIAVFLMLEDGMAENATGWITPFYFLLMYLLSRHIYQAAHASILARIEHQHLAYYDHLTGLANRRAFEEILENEWLRGLRTPHPLSLIIADIDDFKHYNDIYGHAIGDEVLQAMSRMIEDRVRRGADLVARIGGEEFAVILPETDLAGAKALAEQIHQQCHALESVPERIARTPTLSVGVSACVPQQTDDVKNLFQRADKALYEAKKRGKDQVVSSNID